MIALVYIGPIALIGYLLGSIPFGYLLVRVFRRSDIRQIGSGNIGATNVARSSPVLGISTLLLDAGKGFLAVVIALAFVTDKRFTAAAVAAFFAVLGHIFPMWLKFRGGKGVATGVGAFALIVPKGVLVAIAVFAAMVALFRYVSLGSITASAVLPVAIYWLYVRPESKMESVLAAAAAVAVLIICRHHDNISRLLAGTEPRFSLRKNVKEMRA